MRARLTLEEPARNSNWVFHSRDRDPVLEPSLLPQPLCIGVELESGAEPGLRAAPDILTARLNTYSWSYSLRVFVYVPMPELTLACVSALMELSMTSVIWLGSPLSSNLDLCLNLLTVWNSSQIWISASNLTLQKGHQNFTRMLGKRISRLRPNCHLCIAFWFYSISQPRKCW